MSIRELKTSDYFRREYKKNILLDAYITIQKSKNKYLGRYNTELEAFEVYKYYKEKNIKVVADYYKKLIPQKLYNALYSYEVEITD